MSLNYLDLKYLNLLSGQLQLFKRLNDRTYNFRCPLCGDSKNKKKARGYIYEKKGDSRFHCHNCGADMRFHRLIEAVDSNLYSDYQMERIKEGFWTPRARSGAGRSAVAPVVTPVEEPKEDKEAHGSSPLSLLTKISDLPDAHYARKYVADRMIPRDKWDRLYHCPLFFAWVEHFMPGKFSEGALKHDAARLVIPFFNRGGMHAFQGRVYKGNAEAKYITVRTDDSVPKVFGLEALDRSHEAFATEGPIDSLFLPNAIAFAGGDHSILSGYIEPAKTTIIYDNEPRSPETKSKMEKAIRDDLRIVVWPKYIKHKDINKMVQEGMSIGDILDIIKKNTFHGIEASIALSAWSNAEEKRRDKNLKRSSRKPSLEDELFAPAA